MKTLIVYSSLTGNTKRIAEAIAEEIGAEAALFSVEEAPDPAAYDCVAVGFWVDKGTADAKAAAYLRRIHDKRVALFATLGADPRSKHAEDSLENAAALLSAGNVVTGTFICQGKVDPKLIRQMEKMFPSGHPHGMNEERVARHKAASTHPDARDEADARAAFAKIKERWLEHAG